MEVKESLRLNGPGVPEEALIFHVTSSPNRECFDTVHAEFRVVVDN
jgi:hypothetical protein